MCVTKKPMRFEVSIPFPEGDVSCGSCIFMARSCVTATHCSITRAVIPAGEKGRVPSCPLKPI